MCRVIQSFDMLVKGHSTLLRLFGPGTPVPTETAIDLSVSSLLQGRVAPNHVVELAQALKCACGLQSLARARSPSEPPAANDVVGTGDPSQDRRSGSEANNPPASGGVLDEQSGAIVVALSNGNMEMQRHGSPLGHQDGRELGYRDLDGGTGEFAFGAVDPGDQHLVDELVRAQALCHSHLTQVRPSRPLLCRGNSQE